MMARRHLWDTPGSNSTVQKPTGATAVLQQLPSNSDTALQRGGRVRLATTAAVTTHLEPDLFCCRPPPFWLPRLHNLVFSGATCEVKFLEINSTESTVHEINSMAYSSGMHGSLGTTILSVRTPGTTILSVRSPGTTILSVRSHQSW